MRRPASDEDIRMELVKLEFARKGFCLVLSDYGRSRNTITITETTTCVMLQQRVFGTGEFSVEKKMTKLFVLVRD